MSDGRTQGVVIALVTDLQDPDKLGRIKVKYPYLGNEESDWARLSTPMAGSKRGVFFRPDVGDEVLVAFEQADPRRPYILGSLWSKSDKPPEFDGTDKDNNWRFLHSRSGHVILMDDTNGKERIAIIDKDKKRKIIIDCANQKIQVLVDQGDVEVKAEAGKVDVKAKDVQVEATNSVKVKGMTVEIEAQTSLTLKSNGTVSIEGQGAVSLKSSAATSVQGSVVNIN